MKATVQTSLRILGIFLAGSITGIALFIAWADHHRCFAERPAMGIEMTVGLMVAAILVFIPGCLADILDGVNRLKDAKTQNQPPDRTR
jgi:UPF0716 family protein affecting phage T7 exclusion